MNSKVLEIKNLFIKFNKSKKNVVQDLNLKICEGDKYAIIGETGSGKSVMLMSILGLLMDAEIKGNIIFENKDLLTLTDKEISEIRGAKISYVAQGGGSLNPLIKIGLQVGEPLIIHKNRSKKEAILEAIKILGEFNIDNPEYRVNQYPHEFSGGMRQRAMIAMGIIGGAKLLLADEPTKGLDSSRVNLVVESFNKLESINYLVVTHDLSFARKISNKVGVFKSSYLVEEANTNDFYKQPLHPYSQDMIMALPENGLQIYNKSLNQVVIKDGCCIYINRCRYRSVKCQSMPPFIEIGSNRRVRCWMYA